MAFSPSEVIWKRICTRFCWHKQEGGALDCATTAMPSMLTCSLKHPGSLVLGNVLGFTVSSIGPNRQHSSRSFGINLTDVEVEEASFQGVHNPSFPLNSERSMKAFLRGGARRSLFGNIGSMRVDSICARF